MSTKISHQEEATLCLFWEVFSLSFFALYSTRPFFKEQGHIYWPLIAAGFFLVLQQVAAVVYRGLLPFLRVVV